MAPTPFDFRGTGKWAVILGGSSGLGLATAKRLAQAGLHLVIGHKDSSGRVENELVSEFDSIRAQGVELVTYNGNLSDPDQRAGLLEVIEQRVGTRSLHLFLHSIAAGHCKPLVEARPTRLRRKAIEGLCQALTAAGSTISPDGLQRAINTAFHDKGCDLFYALADSHVPASDEVLSEEELAQTIAMMGFDHMLWGRELLARGLLSQNARLIALTSEGNEVAWKGYGAVSAAKCTLEALCRSMAVEMAPYGVRSCIVQAGVSDTPAGNAIPHFDLIKAQARVRNPFGRLTRPEDVADAIYALTLPMMDWVNGAILRVDGGEAISAG